MRMLEIIAPTSKREYVVPFLEAGADAIYAGLKNRTWHANSVEFSWDELISLSEIIHKQSKKLYIVINRNLSTEDVDEILQHGFLFEEKIFDAVIMSDWGCISALHKEYPNAEIHLSANALCLDYSVFDLAKQFKIPRIVFSPSLRFEEMATITRKYPEFEWESIILGSRCYNEVGLCKCVVSDNDVIHKEICRKSYYLYKNDQLLGEKPEIWGFPLLNGNDVEKLLSIGITCWKIEGRDRGIDYLLRSIHYLHQMKQMIQEKDLSLC